ncbi:MAG: pectinesterase family protein, partial [Acidimicrobiia bacterium]|nr:pectinesterase family protein [Acidimicrobiia bacterium]
MKILAILAVLALIAGSLAATVPAHAASDDGVIRVPTDEKTIQGAVDASKPGTLILVSPGVYKEAVVVGPAHKNIVIRGLDRATTIVDGELSAAKGHDNGFLVQADGVAIENITARNFVTNGFYWTGVDGYRGSYLTA